ncbi:hyalin-like [Amphiura filiformis]|uniref:hyalin-like n=1 Tax=Amphiura filiformis TaxID=82378 RepID=UPI003B228CBD
MINCPPDQPVITLRGGTTAFLTFPGATATDDSFVTPTIEYTSIPPGVSFFDSDTGDIFASNVGIGRTTVTATATDAGNTMASCSFTVTVTVNSPPQLLCPSDPATVELRSSTGTTTAVSFPRPSATDDGGLPTLEYASTPPGIMFFESTGNTVLATNVNVGMTTVTVTATDTANNMASCTFELTVTGVDDTPPDVQCPPDIFQSISFGTTETVVRWDEPTVTDTSGQQTILISRTHTSGDVFAGGSPVSVVYIYADMSGNQGRCSFLVSIGMGIDTTAPVVVQGTCPSGVVQVIDINSAPQSVTWELPRATDNSNEVPTRMATHNSGDLFQLGNTEVIYTFCDSTGNCNRMCSFNVFLQEEPPTIRNCPSGAPLIVPADSFGFTAALVQYGPITSDGMLESQTHNTMRDLFEVNRIHNVRINYCNNEAVCRECSFQVNVIPVNSRPVDTTPPTVTNCASDIERRVPLGSPDQFISWRTPTASDPSGVRSSLNNQNYETQRTVAMGSSFLVEYIFEDAVGNTAYCAFSVSVSTTNGPNVFNCPSDITRIVPTGTQSISVSWADPTSSAGPYSSRSQNPGSTFQLGNTLVTYIFRSGSEVTVCDFIVRVIN